MDVLLCFLGLFVSTYSLTLSEFQILTNEIAQSAEPSFPDKFTDVILEELRLYLQTNNDEKIPLGPIDLDFSQNIAGIYIYGHFNAEDGIFKNMSTIERRGESHVTHNSLFEMTLSTVIGFKEMIIFFPKYDVNIAGITEKGSVSVKIGSNSLFLEVYVKYSLKSPHCVVNLTKVELGDFSGISVDMTGLGILNYLGDEITEWVLASYKTSFAGLIRQIISDKLKEEFTKTSLCRFKASYITSKMENAEKLFVALQ